MWGFKSLISIHNLALDTQVYLVGCAYFSILIRAYFDFENKTNLIFLSIFAGYFIWTRGNAFSYLPFLTLPTLIIFFRKKFLKFSPEEKKKLLNLLIKPIIIFLIFTIWFFLFTHKSIINYYLTQQSLIDYNLNILQTAKSILIIFLNYPGAFFSSNSFNKLDELNIYLTIIFYLIFCLVYCYFKFSSNSKLKKEYKEIFILVLLSILFTKFFELQTIPFYYYGMSVQQIHILSLIPFTIFCTVFFNFIIREIIKSFCIFVTVYTSLILLFSTFQGFVNTQFKFLKRVEENNNLITSKILRHVNAAELESFAIKLDNKVQDPKIYTLYYNFYNPVILNYYRLKNKLKRIERNVEIENDIIAPFISNPNFRGGKEKFKFLKIKFLESEAGKIIRIYGIKLYG
jgi:hypothetical protein